MIRWFCAAGAALTLAAAGLVVVGKQSEVNFTRLHDATERLREAGFCCSSDRGDGVIVTGFLVSREAVSFPQACSLRKIGPMGPEWKGKVWVAMNRKDWRLETLPDGAGVRSWGTLTAYGDEEFLKELDACLTPRILSFL